jgi:hypothetical protein
VLHLEAGSSDAEERISRLSALHQAGVEPSRTTQGAECFITAHALDAIWMALKIGLKGTSVAGKNVAWQEVLAALNRRGCLRNEQYEKLIQSSVFRFTE